MEGACLALLSSRWAACPELSSTRWAAASLGPTARLPVAGHGPPPPGTKTTDRSSMASLMCAPQMFPHFYSVANPRNKVPDAQTYGWPLTRSIPLSWIHVVQSPATRCWTCRPPRASPSAPCTRLLWSGSGTQSPVSLGAGGAVVLLLLGAGLLDEQRQVVGVRQQAENDSCRCRGCFSESHRLAKRQRTHLPNMSPPPSPPSARSCPSSVHRWQGHQAICEPAGQPGGRLVHLGPRRLGAGAL